MNLAYILPFLFLTTLTLGQSKKELRAEIDQLKKDKAALHELLNEKKAEIKQLKAQGNQQPNANAKLLQEKDALIDSLNQVIKNLGANANNGGNNNANAAIAQRLKAAEIELDKSQEALKKAQEQIYPLQKELEQEKAKNLALSTELEQKDQLIKKRDEKLALQEKAIGENDALKNQLFGNISGALDKLMQEADYKTTLPKVLAIAQQVQDLSKANPQHQNSLKTYNLKIDWYKSYAAVLKQSDELLAKSYDLKQVVAAIAELKSLKTNAVHQASPGQKTKIDLAIQLLESYCGRFNYVVNKLEDANSFGTYREGALEEVEAAIKRVEKDYTFLVETLKKRKQAPTNKNIMLKKVVCP